MSGNIMEGLIVFYVIVVAVLLLIWHYYRVFSGKSSCNDCGCKCDLKEKEKCQSSKKDGFAGTK